jgi:hypothetical protein
MIIMDVIVQDTSYNNCKYLLGLDQEGGDYSPELQVESGQSRIGPDRKSAIADLAPG